MLFLIIFGALYYGICIMSTQTIEPGISDIPLFRLLGVHNATCGDVHWCTISVTTIRTGLQCCTACSCDQDCYKNNNCCPDYEFGKHTNWSIHESLEEFMEEYSRWTSLVKSNTSSVIKDDGERTCRRAQVGEPCRVRQDAGAYFMSDKCPLNKTRTEVRRKCEFDYFNKTNALELMPSYDELIPVQSLVDGTVYKNKYCSMCSSTDKETTAWSISLQCTINQTPEVYHLYFQNPNTVLYSLFEAFKAPSWHPLLSCNIIFEPERDRIKFTEHNICAWYDFETCPDEKHEESELCEQYTSPIRTFSGPNETMKVYKNAACLACNGDSILKSASCYTWHNIRQVKMTLHVPKQMAEVSVTKPLDDRLYVVFPGDSSYGCQAGELYDELSGFCRKVFCPRGMFAFQGTCHYFFTHFNGGGFIVPLKLTPRTKVANHTEFASAVYSLFVKLGETDPRVSITDHSVYGKREKFSEFLVYLSLSLDDTHGTMSDVIDFIRRVQTNKHYVTDSTSSIKIDMSIAESVRPVTRLYIDLRDGEYYSLLFPKNWQRKLVYVTFDINEGNYCYRVAITKSEYTWVTNAMTNLRIESTQNLVYDHMPFSTENLSHILVCMRHIVGVESQFLEGGTNEPANYILVADDSKKVVDYVELAIAPVLFISTCVVLSISCALRSRRSGQHRSVNGTL